MVHLSHLASQCVLKIRELDDGSYFSHIRPYSGDIEERASKETPEAEASEGMRSLSFLRLTYRATCLGKRREEGGGTYPSLKRHDAHYFYLSNSSSSYSPYIGSISFVSTC